MAPTPRTLDPAFAAMTMAERREFYLAAADLIPVLQHDRSLRALIVQTSLIILGIAIMVLLRLAE